MNNTDYLKLKGANMDIDLTSNKNDIAWSQDKCPRNEAENTQQHKCAVKNTSICEYFKGIKEPDIVICSFKK